MSSLRVARLDALAEMHSQWVAENLDDASKYYDLSGRPDKTDYNQHHVDIDATGDALDEFDEQAMAILEGRTRGPKPSDPDGKTKAFLAQMAAKHLPGLHDQRTHGRHSAANRARQAAEELEGLRESVNRAQAHMGGSLLREDHGAADRRLLGDRLRRHASERSDVLERTERQASGSGADARQAQASLRTAKFALAHDRAQVLAKLEEIVSINEGLDDPKVVGRQLRVALGRDNLTDDPRLAPLTEAVETGDTGTVVSAINEIAASAGLRRIGGDQRLGPDQILPFDPKQHEALGQRPRDGQMALLVRPGYAASVDGEESVISKAVVMVADPGDIARAREAEAARPGKRAGAPESSELDRLKAEEMSRFVGTPEQARRHVEANLARMVGDALAEIEEASGKNASDRALLHLLNARAKREPIDLVSPELRSRLTAAVNGGDRAELRQTIAQIAMEHHVQLVGTHGGLVPYDPQRHKTMDDDRPQPGQTVEVFRPGRIWTDPVTGEQMVLDDAVVRVVNQKASAKHLPGRHDQSAHGRRRGGASAVSSAAKWMSPDEAMAMREKMLAGQPWTDDQKDALERYVGSSYAWMNAMLRGNPDASDRLAEEDDTVQNHATELLRDAHATMRPTTEPVKVKRFVAGYESFGLDMNKLTRDEAAEALKAMEGETLQEPGFMSTSLRESYGNDTWTGRFKLELDVPAGAPGAYLDSDVGFEREQELLLAPGTRFEVTEVVIDPPRNTVRGRVVVDS